jgi:hypothetical protein
MRGGEVGGDVNCVAGKALKVEIALGRNEMSVDADARGCFTSVETTAGACCCAVQQVGRVWLMGARLGQWLQEDGFGCSAGMHIVVLSRSVSRQRNDAKLERAFFIPVTLDASTAKLVLHAERYLKSSR